jgi:ankyrin repeat protein
MATFRKDRLCDVICIVVQYGASSDINDCSGATPLFFALELNNSDIVRFLVEEAGSDVNAYNYKVQTPLHIASYYGNIDMVKYLVEKGAQVSLSHFLLFRPQL